MAGESGYIRKEVTELLGIRHSTIEVYVNNGIIVPEIDNPGGKGTRRRFSKRNLLQILITQRLVKLGLSLAEVRDVLEPFALLKDIPMVQRSKLPDVLSGKQKEKAVETVRLTKTFWESDTWDKNQDVYLMIVFDGSEGRKKWDSMKARLWFPTKKDAVISVKLSELGEGVNVYFVNLLDLKMRVVKM